MPTILITGSTGYIGSNILTEIFNKKNKRKYNVVCIDNGVNSFRNKVYKNVAKICRKRKISRYPTDLTILSEVENIFKIHRIDYIIHLAALKSVSESINKPLLYYKNNIISTMNLLECCSKYKVKGFIFSSSATVYSPNQPMPLTEESDVGNNLTNPYAKTKYFMEEIIKDFNKVNPQLKCIILRYFNPIGNHHSRLINEKSKTKPTNLIPNILNVLSGKQEKLYIYGNNYETKDGTCIRDFIHIKDLVTAHIFSLQYLIHREKDIDKCLIYNVGTGVGTTVMDIVNYLEIPYEIKERRKGDLGVVYCSNEKIKNELMWKPKYTYKDSLRIYK